MGASHHGVLLWAIIVEFYVNFAEKWSWKGWMYVYCCWWCCNGCFIDNQCCRSCNNWFCVDLCWWFWNDWLSVECCDGLEFVVIQLIKFCCFWWWRWSCNEPVVLNFLPSNSRPNCLHDQVVSLDSPLATGRHGWHCLCPGKCTDMTRAGLLWKLYSVAGSLVPCNF